MFIGRFSVETEEHLENMVEKTIYFESEYGFLDTWRNSTRISNMKFEVPGAWEVEEYQNFVK